VPADGDHVLRSGVTGLLSHPNHQVHMLGEQRRRVGSLAEYAEQPLLAVLRRWVSSPCGLPIGQA
jgi:hypothetical protein